MAERRKKTASPDAMSLGEHLDELRRRLIYGLAGLVVAVGASLAFGKVLLYVLEQPYLAVIKDMGLQAPPAALAVTDAFSTYFRVSLLAGVLIASPWLSYQIWLFVAAGLLPHEKRYVRWVAPFCALLFVGGAVFFLMVIAKPMLRFFMSFNQWLEVQSVIQLRELIALMTNMMLVFGLTFQTPMVVLALVKMGLVSISTLHKYRRHVILVVVIFAAAVTPTPDVLNQMALAVPMWLLYEVGILLAYIFGRPKRQPT